LLEKRLHHVKALSCEDTGHDRHRMVPRWMFVRVLIAMSR